MWNGELVNGGGTGLVGGEVGFRSICPPLFSSCLFFLGGHRILRFSGSLTTPWVGVTQQECALSKPPSSVQDHGLCFVSLKLDLQQEQRMEKR